MLDIETLGIEPGAAILSIGACTFDTDGVGETFHRSVGLQHCQERGLSIDAETLQWWLDQDEGAAVDLLTTGAPLATVLSELRDYLETHDYDELWANSPKFDMVHLEAAYEALGWSVPWDFYELRDVRTVQALPGAVELEHEGTEHDALDDAVHQAREVGATLRALDGVRDAAKSIESGDR
jgi:hypothetical protein